MEIALLIGLGFVIGVPTGMWLRHSSGPNRRRWLALVAAIALLLSACGSRDGEESSSTMTEFLIFVGVCMALFVFVIFMGRRGDNKAKRKKRHPLQRR